MTRLFQSLLTLVLLTNVSTAAVVFDSGGFEAYSIGALVGQNGWADFNVPNGNRFTVQSAVTNGGVRGVVASSTSDVAAFVAPAVNYTPVAGELVNVSVDIARTIAQFPFQPSSNGFNVDIYDPGGNRILGFGLGVNANNNAIVPFVTRGNGTPAGTQDTINLAVAQNQFVNFRAEMNFDSDTFRLFVNGSDATGVLNFVNLSTTLGDADLQHDSVVNAQDNGYFDNYLIETTAVPEPGSMLLATLMVSGLFLRRRQRS